MTPIHVKHPDPQTPARPYPARLAKGEPRRCNVPGCGRPVNPTSRGHKCSRCAVAQSRGRTAEGPCAVCGTRDLRVLRRVELADGEVVLCCNDAAIAGRLGFTLAQLRVEAGAVRAA